MSTAINSPALARWRNVAHAPAGRTIPATRLDLPASWLNANEERLVISRAPAADLFPGPGMDEIDVLLISMSLPDARPPHARLVAHIANIHGETYAAASVEQPARSIRGNSIYRRVFVASDNLPVSAMTSASAETLGLL